MRRIPNTQYVSNLTGESIGIWCTQFSVEDIMLLSIEELYAIAEAGPNPTIDIQRSKRAQRDMLDFVCDLYNVPHTVSNSADYLYRELYKVAEKETSKYPTEGNFTLDLDKLENVVERTGKIIARCPACAAKGRDSQGNHLVIFDNGAFSCIIGDANHRKEIYQLARKPLNTSRDQIYMANLERLTKRVKKLEEWIEENEDMGGPKGLLETMSFLVNEARTYGLQYRNAQEQFTNLRGLCFGFLEERGLGEEWDEYLKKKDEEKDALQKQETESLPVRDEPETSEGVREEDAEEQETTEQEH